MAEEHESSMVEFEEKHLIAIMLFLSINRTCRKIDIYTKVSSNPRIPDKLDKLESLGLITQTMPSGTRSVIISLTEKGGIVADNLAELDKIVKS